MKKTTLLMLLAVSYISVLSSCKDDIKDPEPSTTTTQGNNNPKGAIATYSMNALIGSSQIVKSEVSSCLDHSKNTHIAWIEDNGSIRSVKYSKFDFASKTFSTKTVATGVDKEKNVSPEIVVDNSGTIHITYFKRRENEAGTKPGNYAVMYATSSGGAFAVSQVSTNGTSPSDNTHNNYNCYVNGRPKIFIKGGSVNIIYMAEGSNLNGYDKYFVQATKSGSSWTRKQLINAQDHASTNADRGLAVAQHVSTLYGAQISTGDYSPFFLSQATAWKKQKISGYAGTFANKHIQLVEDKDNNAHISWFNTINKKFIYGIVNSAGMSELKEVPIKVKNHGNFFPSTVDRETKEHVFFYHDYSGNGYLITNSGSTETKIDTKDIGVVHGHNALHVYDGYISLTTASKGDDKIYVTIQD